MLTQMPLGRAEIGRKLLWWQDRKALTLKGGDHGLQQRVVPFAPGGGNRGQLFQPFQIWLQL